MSEFKLKNNTVELNNLNQINVTENQTSLKPFQKIIYFSLIFLLIFFLFIFISILIILIRRHKQKSSEKMRRIKLQNEINKIMMIDIFETRSPNVDSSNKEFHSINNDSSLNDLSSSFGSNNVLSEINIHNDIDSKETNDN